MKIAKWPAVATMTALLGITALPAQSAPLPDGTLLTIKPGVVSADGLQCLSGSCFGMVFSWPNVPFYFVPLKPGKDGGIVIGKNQRSGGQEVDWGLLSNYLLEGDIAGAIDIGASMGTFATAPLVGANNGPPWEFSVSKSNASHNRFNDSSCAGAGCIGLTELGSLNFGWNWTVGYFGTAANPCVHPSVAINPCTADQMAGISINNWTVKPDKTYMLDYSWVSAEPSNALYQRPTSGFQVLPIRLHLEGKITTNPTVLESIWKIPNVGALWLFGKGLVRPPNGSYSVNGVVATIVQPVDTTMYLFLPAGVTAPYSVTVSTPDGTSTYPRPN